MLVIGTALFGTPSFKNCIVNGIVLAEVCPPEQIGFLRNPSNAIQDGRKMSKRLQNYPPPNLIMDKYGSDALRIYLINSPVVRAEPLRFKESGVKEVVAKVLLPLWNSYK